MNTIYIPLITFSTLPLLPLLSLCYSVTHYPFPSSHFPTLPCFYIFFFLFVPPFLRPSHPPPLSLTLLSHKNIRLRRAIHLNDLSLVRRIVGNNPSAIQNPDEEDGGNTSLHLAAKLGFLEIAVSFLGLCLIFLFEGRGKGEGLYVFERREGGGEDEEGEKCRTQHNRSPLPASAGPHYIPPYLSFFP